MTAARSLFAAALLLGSLAAGLDGFAQAAPKRFALVVGISSYPGLPPEAGLSSALGDASRVALALKEQAGFSEVRLLTDSAATHAGIEAALRDDLAKLVTERDLLLVYFVGHGIGGDFDDPYLLTFDSDQKSLPGSAWSVGAFARDIEGYVAAGSYVVLTDASHTGTVNGIPLLGPAASSWPTLRGTSLVVSATQLRQPGAEGAFAHHVVDALTGGADFSKDGTVTSAELMRYLLLVVPDQTKNTQYPAESGRHDGNLALATGVKLRATLPPHLDPNRPTVVVNNQPDDLLNYTVDKVKFVFHGTTGSTVQCRDQAVQVCEPQCYVREVKAGACEITAWSGSQKLTGKALVAARGLLVCEPAGGATINCRIP